MHLLACLRFHKAEGTTRVPPCQHPLLLIPGEHEKGATGAVANPEAATQKPDPNSTVKTEVKGIRVKFPKDSEILEFLAAGKGLTVLARPLSRLADLAKVRPRCHVPSMNANLPCPLAAPAPPPLDEQVMFRQHSLAVFRERERMDNTRLWPSEFPKQPGCAGIPEVDAWHVRDLDYAS